MRITRRGILAFPLAFMAVIAVADPASGQEKKAAKKKTDYKMIICDDEFLKGKNVAIRQTVPNMAELKFNDKSESLQWHLPPNRVAILFDETEFARPVLILVGKGEVNDLGKEHPNALHCISSIAAATAFARPVSVWMTTSSSPVSADSTYSVVACCRRRKTSTGDGFSGAT